jgi:hypothetical protein
MRGRSSPCWNNGTYSVGATQTSHSTCGPSGVKGISTSTWLYRRLRKFKLRVPWSLVIFKPAPCLLCACLPVTMFTRYSTTSCIIRFFILRASQALISSLWVLPSGFDVLLFTCSVLKLFPLHQLVLQRRHAVTITKTVSSASARYS